MAQANKIIPCRWAGTPNKGSGRRAADGEVKAYTHIGLPMQETRIPDSVPRITRHKGRGIETEHPAVFPVAAGLPPCASAHFGWSDDPWSFRP
jgi:hypothetical protein